MNKVILIGRLGKDPESRSTSTGTTVVNFSLATSRKYNGKEQTQWHNCVAFSGTGDTIARYVNKGDQLAVEGEISYRTWDDKNGNKRTSTEIIVQSFHFVGGKSAPAQNGSNTIEPDTSITDEDIPF